MNWKVLKSTYTFKCPWLQIRKDHVRLPSGIEIPDFYVEELPNWVNVIAVTKEGKFLIEEQYRHGIGRICFELCAGVVEKGESPLEAAKRELLEETGTESDEWTEFGYYAPNTSGCNNLCYTFIANNIKKGVEQSLDKTEDIKIHLLTEQEVKRLMLDGHIAEAVMLAPLWKYFANKKKYMAYKIPLFNLNFDEREAQAAYDTIKSGWISTGPKNAELEQMFIDMWKVKYAVSMSNCTDALHVCCMVCGFGPDDEVIVPSLTFAASCNCIRYVGATPVFADIVGPDHINIDPADIERKITPKTKGIVVVHMAGFPARMDEIMAIARKHNLKVIEDACHGPLSEYKGKKLGTIGDCASFSFFSNKNISTGEGGMFITNNEEMAAKARLIRSHGMSTMSYQRASGHATEYDITCLGYNFRMDDIRAAIAIEQLKKLPGDLETRIKVRKQYVDRLSKIEGLVVPFADNTEFVSNYILPTVLLNSTKERRNKIREYIHEAGVQTSVHYPAAHRFSTYKELGAVLPQTEYVTDNEITLPMYAALTEEQVDFICDVYEKAIKEIK